MKINKFSDFIDALTHGYMLSLNKRREDDDFLLYILDELEPHVYVDKYKFGDSFSKELIKTKIEFETGHFGDETFRGCIDISGRYLFFKYKKIEDKNLKTPSGKTLEALFCVYGINKKTGHDFYFYIPVGGDFQKTISSETRPTCESERTKLESGQIDLDIEWPIIANAVAYLKSGNPDLREYKPPLKGNLVRRERDRIVSKFGNEECILVSWGWKKPHLEHKQVWEVEGHFFWAATGERRKKRTLTWRVGHTRERAEHDQPKN